MNTAGSQVPDFGWVFLLIGLVIALPGLWLFYWAILKDRSRGRRRCPKCWYDMSGTTGMTCSECGYYAKRERKFFKTRRRWRTFAVALVLLALACAVLIMPIVQNGGWIRLVPTTVIILQLPETAGPNMVWTVAMEQRLKESDLWDWQIRALFNRYKDNGSAPWGVSFYTRTEWPEESEVFYVADFARTPLGLSLFDEKKCRVRVEDPIGTRSEMVLSAFEATLAGGLWRDRFICIRAARQQTTAKLRVRVDILARGIGERSSDWVDIWSDEPVVRFRVDKRLKDHMTPVQSIEIDRVIRDRTWVAVYDGAIRVLREFPSIPELGQDGALGAVIELMHNDEVVASTTAWWGNNNAQRSSELLPWDRGGFDVQQMKSAPNDRWRVRIRGDAELALRAFDDHDANSADQSRFWSGQVEIPLRLGEPGYYAIPQRAKTPWNSWGWSWRNEETRRR